MAWFGTDPAAELDVKIEEATSEAIPNGEMDMAVAMEITDLIRSKKVPPKQAMRGLKKRLTKVYANPNTLAAVLKLADVCVKNGGSHFLAEINQKEFIDYLVEYIFKVHYDVKNYKVYSSDAKHAIGVSILKLIKEWSLYFEDKYQGNYLGKVFTTLTNQGYEFPAVDVPLQGNASNFVDSETPPDWVDGRECMICYNPFSVMNRKHHCRACGGVFCQTHSSNNVPLVSLGILQPVRVCDDCFQINKNASERGERNKDFSSDHGTLSQRPISASADDEDEQLKKAIELSLQDSSVPVSYGQSEPPVSSQPVIADSASVDDEEEQIKAAIAASLAEYQSARKPAHAQVPENFEPTENRQNTEPESEFYSNIMPFGSSAHRAQESFTDTQVPSASRHDHVPIPLSNESQTTFTQGIQPQSSQTQQNRSSHQQNYQGQSQPRPVEDLTPQEEEDINLFVQLMSGIKSDPSKQASILYDQNLGELHGKVVRLKPKLNRALRSSIEKYEVFLEMNNKINSITRLYDQFLDHKLNQAYNKHSISSPGASYTQPQMQSQHQQQNQHQIQPHQTESPRFSQQFFFDRNQSSNIATGSQNAEPQPLVNHATAPQMAPYSTYQTLPQQHTAPQNSANQPTREFALRHQATAPCANAPQTTGFQTPTVHAQTTGHSHTEYLSTFPAVAASEPDLDEGSHLPNLAPVSIQQEQIPGRHRRESRAPYPSDVEGVFEPNLEEFEEQIETQTAAHGSQEQEHRPANNIAHPQVPSSPPVDAFSDTESVASRYPPVEGDYNENNENPENEGPREHASARFPSLNELNLPDLSQEPLTDLEKQTTNESRKFKAEPEPLIEL